MKVLLVLFVAYLILTIPAFVIVFRAGRRIGHKEGYDMKKFSGHVTEALKLELKKLPGWNG